MKVILEIPDKQFEFAMRVLRSLSFVKKARPMSADAAKLWEDLKESADEVKMHKEGKLKLRTASDLLNEL